MTHDAQSNTHEQRLDFRDERIDPTNWPLRGTFYVCRWCGYHPNNRASWCGAGCGSDYNHMFKVSSS